MREGNVHWDRPVTAVVHKLYDGGSGPRELQNGSRRDGFDAPDRPRNILQVAPSIFVLFRGHQDLHVQVCAWEGKPSGLRPKSGQPQVRAVPAQAELQLLGDHGCVLVAQLQLAVQGPHHANHLAVEGLVVLREQVHHHTRLVLTGKEDLLPVLLRFLRELPESRCVSLPLVHQTNQFHHDECQRCMILGKSREDAGREEHVGKLDQSGLCLHLPLHVCMYEVLCSL
mmetsp:Transcript_27314/g.77057  ORF Transcript_27314/g.77057 Transcript_27314/m.77057 type:complete len:227 (+) Transcript_27314:1308-1988(+)